MIFHGWFETWDKKKLGTTGDPIFESRIVRKYRDLKWIDPDNYYTLWNANPNNTSFIQKRGNSECHIFVKLEGYDISIPLEAQLNLYGV